jgi:hypothetical protein
MIEKKLIAVLLLVGTHSFAQLNKSRVMISGRGNVHTNKTEDANTLSHMHNTEKNFGGSVYLNAGYFLSNNFAIGGILGLSKNSYERDYDYLNNDRVFQETISKSYTTGIFARYNYMIRQSKFGLFFQLDNTYSWGRFDDKSTTYSNGMPYIKSSKERNHSFNIGLTPGLMYFINNRLSIETSIGDFSYNSTITKDEPLELNVRKESNFNANFSASTLYFGLTFYLGGKKNEDTKSAASESK